MNAKIFYDLQLKNFEKHSYVFISVYRTYSKQNMAFPNISKEYYLYVNTHSR